MIKAPPNAPPQIKGLQTSTSVSEHCQYDATATQKLARAPAAVGPIEQASPLDRPRANGVPVLHRSSQSGS
jgi:hypothetical protein